MKRLILHIGTKKTGSTALQGFLYLNRERFEQNGICYYRPVRNYRDYPTYTNGSFLDGFFLDDANASEEERAVETNNFRSGLRDFHTVVISDELLWMRPEEYWRKVNDFVRDCAGEEIEILPTVYLRRQDEYMAADWKETMKSSYPFRRNCTPIRWWNEVKAEQFDLEYNYILKGLENAFGIGNVTLRIYDRSQMIGGSIITDFCRTFDLPIDGSFEYPDRAGSNISLTNDAAYAMMSIGTFLSYLPGVKFSTQQKLRESAIRYSMSRKAEGGGNPYSPEERKEILAFCENGNRAIAERYFQREELFNADMGTATVFRPNIIKNFFTMLRIWAGTRKIGSDQ